MAKIPVGIQLYTLRNLTKDDFAGTMKKVAQAGYSGVEMAGFGNLATAKEARKAIDDAGLKVYGAHAGLEALEKDPNKAFDEASTLGHKNIIIPSVPETRRKDADGWKQIAQSMNKLAQQAKDRGFNFAYHNHSFEFQKFNGQTGF